MKRSDWPNLGQLIDSNKRIIVFLDEGADGRDGGIVDFILPQFQMVFTSKRLFPSRCGLSNT